MNTPCFRAVEFFSGLGAFAAACRNSNIKVVAAFDQGQEANIVYHLNHGLKPCARNLDSILPGSIPDADIWWLSPPCTPYTVKGVQRDDQDSRAQSLKKLTELLSDKLPPLVLVENVIAFQSSRMFERLLKRLDILGYTFTARRLCSTDFGTPMKRPRVFLIAVRDGFALSQSTNEPVFKKGLLKDYLKAANPELKIPSALLESHSEGMHIVDAGMEDAYAICFTSGYAKSFKASGSFLEEEGGVRRFSPEEILSLLGFPQDFRFPEKLKITSRFRLVGNSVDVRSIKHVLKSVEPPCQWVEMLPERGFL